MKSLISIIVPIYNVEQYIQECIESIQKQTYQNIQIILVNDGSTDLSGEICNRYAESDDRIKVIHQQNQGLVLARKKGLKAATGDYIGFVDGDDYIAPDMFEKLLCEIQISNSDFVHSGFMSNGRKSATIEKKTLEFSGYKEKEDFIRIAILGRRRYITPSIWSKLFKAEFIQSCYEEVPDEAQYGEDVINLCICLMKCNKITILNEAYYYYRIREGSITRKKEFKNLKDSFKCYEYVYDVLKRYGCSEELKNVIIINAYNNILNKLIECSADEFQMARYYYPQVDLLQGKRVVIYGAGAVGKDYYAQICRYTDCEVVAWVDTDSEKYSYPYIKIYGTSILNKIKFDVLVIAVKNEETAKQIHNQLLDYGISPDKIFWDDPREYIFEGE